MSVKTNRPKTVKKPMGIWPFIIVGMLIVHVSGMMLAMVIAQRNKPPVVENYYQKAVEWDKNRQVAGR